MAPPIPTSTSARPRQVPRIEEQGLGWKNTFGSGNGDATITSGLEGAWTTNPVKWDNDYFDHLFGYEWELTKSPAGGNSGRPRTEPARGTIPDAHDPSKKHAPMMFTTDLALKLDPSLRADREALPREPAMNSRTRSQGVVQADAPRHGADLALSRPARSRRAAAVARPRSARHASADRRERHRRTQGRRSSRSGLSVSQLVTTAWASASTFRGTDKRGGANGARIRLAPQKDWEVNQPAQLATVLETLEKIQDGFNASQSGGKKVSLADVIVLGGCAAIEQAAKNAGHDVKVPFAPGRTDASQDQTDVHSFAVLEPTADGFRNYLGNGHAQLAAKSCWSKRRTCSR